MLGSITIDLDPVDRGRSTVGGRGPPARVAQDGLAGLDYMMSEFIPMTPFKRYVFVSPVSRGTQIPYLAAIDLAERCRVPLFPFLESPFALSGREPLTTLCQVSCLKTISLPLASSSFRKPRPILLDLH
ncbi:hypothetical protein M9H77_33809 [Catharanthus roseus]|uniref:Uncharacterized protein n=1 Tax=Catharanthus roseus TaxID=4058 RepID=A0ACB9ZL30_CATRO|nr:hypothetical protein M9H77_33809 [Catharanthus roseus]